MKTEEQKARRIRMEEMKSWAGQSVIWRDSARVIRGRWRLRHDKNKGRVAQMFFL